MSKKNTILLVVLIIQLAIIGFVYRPGQQQVAQATSFFDFQVSQISGLTIADDEGKTISLAKQGESWLVGEQKYPADQETILAILKKISEAKSTRLVTRTRSSHVRLKVAEEVFNRKLTINLGEADLVVFYLGTSPNSKTIHFRLNGSNDVYVVKDLSTWELQADQDSWWQTKYIDMGMADLTGLRLKNSGGVIAMTKVDQDWGLAGSVPTGMNVSQDKVESVVESVRKITITEYLGKTVPQDLGEPMARIDYSAGDRLVGLDIWPATEEGGDHVVKGSDQAFYAKVASYAVKEAMEATIDGFFEEVTEVEEPVEEEKNNQ